MLISSCCALCWKIKIQSNFYKLNDHYPEKNFNLQKLQVKEVKSNKISINNAVALLQLIEVQVIEVQVIEVRLYICSVVLHMLCIKKIGRLEYIVWEQEDQKFLKECNRLAFLLEIKSTAICNLKRNSDHFYKVKQISNILQPTHNSFQSLYLWKKNK